MSWKTKLHLDNIYLDKDNAWIFGVCAGIGKAHNLAPQLVRVCAIISGSVLCQTHHRDLSNCLAYVRRPNPQ